MAHRTDDFERPDILPVPELNPLINPLLAQNMGRWAEVYFTSPPEKRDEKVLELLHELEAESSHSATDVRRQPVPNNSSESNAWSTLHPPAVQIQKRTVRCDSCGHDNPEAQRFCGMCGAKLDAAYAEANSNFFPDGGTERFDRTDRTESDRELPSLRSGSEFESLDGKFGWTLDSEPSSRSYRFYIGTVLAIIILMLGYIAWRTTQSASLSPAPQSATTEASAMKAQDASPAAPNPGSTPESQQAASTHEDAADSGKPAIPTAESSAQKDSGRKESSAAENSQQNAQPNTTLGNGSQELAMAHKYLDGTGGQGRDSSEAAKWLWQSVAKHNSDATLLLSDLYLRGDGVPQNCDQARILLDAAASKGSKDAGERLRHMQAFGCQ